MMEEEAWTYPNVTRKFLPRPCMQCAHALVKACGKEPRTAVRREAIMAAVDRELAVGTVLGESHRKQQSEPGESGTEWLDELLRDKAHGSLAPLIAVLTVEARCGSGCAGANAADATGRANRAMIGRRRAA